MRVSGRQTEDVVAENLGSRYEAAEPRAVTIGGQAASLLTGDGAEEPVLMAFIDRAEKVDPSVLDKLERMIRKRRKSR